MIRQRNWVFIAAVMWIASGPRIGTAWADDFQVNTYTTSHQSHPSVALDADGDFVVVWQSYGSGGTDSSFRSIQGQRYAADGSTVGGEFQVNTYTTSYQRNSAVAVDADGDFVVVWNSLGSGGTDSFSSGYSIQASATLRTDPQWAGSSRSTPTPRATSLAPRWRWTRTAQTLPWDIRFDLTDLSVADGFATGLVVITEGDGTTAPNLEGDYFRLDSGNDFATGDRLVRPEDFCSQQEVRFVDFGSGAQLRVLLDRPRGVETASFTYTAYDQSGGFATAKYSAFGRYSVELNAACRTP